MENKESASSENIPAAAEESKAKSIVGMGLTIVGLVLSWMGLCGGFPGFLSAAVSIVGMLLAKKPPFKKVAKLCGIIGIAAGAVSTVIGFVLILVGVGRIIG